MPDIGARRSGLPTMDHRELTRRLDAGTQGQDNLDGALAEGRGVVWHCRTAATGIWTGCGWPRRYGTFATVAERLKPESLYRRFIEYRESLGFEVIPLSGANRPPFEVLCDRLRDNRVVCLMAERDLTRTGVEVDFFGEPTRMPAGPAKLAIATGAALLPSHCWFDGDGWACRWIRRWTPAAATCARSPRRWPTSSPSNIAAHPEDWHMLQPQWLADLSDDRQAWLEGG